MPRRLGITTLQLLAAIRDGEVYGLELVAATGLPSGTVYPTLGRLRKRGMIRAAWEDQRIADREGRPRRRYYELTSQGAAALAEGLEQLQALTAELRPREA